MSAQASLNLCAQVDTSTPSTSLPQVAAGKGEVKITCMSVETTVRNRYAESVVRVEYENSGQSAAEMRWGLALPEQAFITGFVLKSGEVEKRGRVAEREAARQTYEGAVARGVGAAHVATEARDANVFSTAVHVPAGGRASLTLNYEELLARQHGRYRLRLHLQHGQVLPRLHVAVTVRETRPLRDLQVSHPQLAAVRHEGDTVAHVTFSPTPDQQQQMANEVGPESDNNQTQFDVEYDVERDPSGGEVLVNDGYFVHFFAPTELKPIPKHIIFILDVSGSMAGRKINQLKEAMRVILKELHEYDYFNIIKFSDSVAVLNKNYKWQKIKYNGEEVPKSFQVNKKNINSVEAVINNLQYEESTNIYSALISGLRLSSKDVNIKEHKLKSIIVFLTDGEATSGEVTDSSKIIELISCNNSINNCTIFTLGFGDDVDKEFLKELALTNSGFFRVIYEASDSALQLQDFYKQISSPLLTDVHFRYTDACDITNQNFNILFLGSEFVVAGKVDTMVDDFVFVEATTVDGPNNFYPVAILKGQEEFGSLERLWAYLTIKQLLDLKYKQKEEERKNSEHEALQLALKYSFVTPLTSLVVVLPDATENVEDVNGIYNLDDNYDDIEDIMRLNILQTMTKGMDFDFDSEIDMRADMLQIQSRSFLAGPAVTKSLKYQSYNHSLIKRLTGSPLFSRVKNFFKKNERELDLSQIHTECNVKDGIVYIEEKRIYINDYNLPQKNIFEVIVPEGAILTGFFIEIEGENFTANGGDKSKLEKDYQKAVSQKKNAVLLDYNCKQIAIYLLSETSITCILKYEIEVGQKEDKVFEIPINLFREIKICVDIEEENPIKNIHTDVKISGSTIQYTGAQIDKLEDNKIKIFCNVSEDEYLQSFIMCSHPKNFLVQYEATPGSSNKTVSQNLPFSYLLAVKNK